MSKWTLRKDDSKSQIQGREREMIKVFEKRGGVGKQNSIVA